MDTLLSGALLYVTIAWGVITGALILLLLYRGVLSSREEGKDQLYLDGAEEHAAADVQKVADRLLRLSRPIMTLSVLSVLLLLTIGVMWIQARLSAPPY